MLLANTSVSPWLEAMVVDRWLILKAHASHTSPSIKLKGLSVALLGLPAVLCQTGAAAAVLFLSEAGADCGAIGSCSFVCWLVLEGGGLPVSDCCSASGCWCTATKFCVECESGCKVRLLMHL